MNENQAEIKANIVESEMKKYFGSLVSDFNLIDAFYGNGYEEFSLGFKYCDYFDMRFNYGQGACGCCICYDWGDNNEAILIKTTIDGWWEKISIQWKKYFYELKKDLDLRIPDDYLKEFLKNKSDAWHHEAETGRMQLVDENIHSDTRHTGGRAIWGGGSDAR